MRCNIYHVDQATGAETLNNVRYPDEIGEDNGFTDAEIDAMEQELRTTGRYWIGGGAAPLFLVKPTNKGENR